MQSGQATVYLGLGSNLGDRARNLKRALKLLNGQVNLGMMSAIYETAPVGNTNQPRFLNMACVAATSLSPRELLTMVKDIENKMGRTQGPPNSPRPIDIDILLYGNEILDTPDLKIPHPRLQERAFVLVPLAEMAPDLVHPVYGKKIREMLDELKRKPGDVALYLKG